MHKLFSLFALLLLLASCGGEDALQPSNADTYGFEVPQSDNSAEATLRRSFQEKYGSYLLFNDTLSNGELLDLGYNITASTYAYVYTFELDESPRTEWAAGSLFPNLLTAISSVLWVESGEDNDVYQQMLEEAAQNTDYDAVQRLMRSMEPEESALWFGHQVSMFREEPGGKDRYWVVFHNTEG